MDIAQQLEAVLAAAGSIDDFEKKGPDNQRIFVEMPPAKFEATLRQALDEIARGRQLQARMEEALPGTAVELGDDENGQPRVVIHTTMEALRGMGGNLFLRTVHVVPGPRA